MQKTVKEIQGHVYLLSYQVMVSERTLFIHEESIHLFPLTVAICDESTAREGFQFSTPIDSNFFCC